MKSQPDQNRITLLVVRDAGKPVRQLRVSKPMALAIPAAAALSISSLVTSMHYHSAQSISQLEAEAAALSLHNLRMEIQVADKEEALQQLQMEVTNLSDEAEIIKDKLKSVSELEQQLQSLIKNQNSPASGKSGGTSADTSSADAAAATAAIAAVKATVASQMGGEYIAVHDSEAIQLVQETKDDFEEIRSLLDEMVNSIPLTITEAKKASSLQAKKLLAEKAQRAPEVMWPTLSKVISSSFGYRTDPFKGSSAFHAGIDIAGNSGDPVFAAKDGVVLTVEQKGARGKYIIIKHEDGLETWYLHLSGMNVSPGDKVKKGQKIGLLGNTGRSTGPHLHFQVVKQNKPVNPLGYVTPNS